MDISKIIDTILELIPIAGDTVIQIIIIIAILIVGSMFIKKLCSWIKNGLSEVDADEGLKKFLVSFIRVACYVLLVFIIADRLGVRSTSLVAVLGSAGVAIGLGLQGSLANFAGGIIILFMKPFVVGDYIIFSDGEGTVKSIDIIYTTIVTLDNTVITVPNGTLSNGVITNVTKLEYRRLDLPVGISYSSDLKKAKDVARSIIEQEPLVIKDKEIGVYVDSLGDSSVVLGMVGWVKEEDYWEARWNIIENTKLEFDKNGIEIPVKQLDVHMIGER